MKCYGECVLGKWDFSDWEECSVSCGGGTRRRTAKCLATSDGRALARQFCPKNSISLRTSCNNTPCPKWNIGAWRECSTTCGRGIQSRLVLCKKHNDILPPASCSGQLPQKIRSCQESNPCPKWDYSAWSFCSSSCGEGLQTRKVTVKSSWKLII